jgi:hypothetical protein
LANNELTEMIVTAIEHHENLTELNLSRNLLDFVPAILPTIGKSLEILILDDNPIIEFVSETFSGLSVQKPVRKLQFFDFRIAQRDRTVGEQLDQAQVRQRQHFRFDAQTQEIESLEQRASQGDRQRSLRNQSIDRRGNYLEPVGQNISLPLSFAVLLEQKRPLPHRLQTPPLVQTARLRVQRQPFGLFLRLVQHFQSSSA